MLGTNRKRTALISIGLFFRIIFFKEFKDVIPFLDYLPLLITCIAMAWLIDGGLEMRETYRQEQMDRALRKLVEEKTGK